MQHVPLYIPIAFGLTTLLSIVLFYKAARHSGTTLVVLIAWLLLQAGIGLSGFYTNTQTLPPRFVFLIGPPLLLIVLLFTTGWGRRYVDRLDLKALSLLHTIRIPVEVVLFWLFLQKAVPQLMTFEGRNLDILSGLTAFLIYYFGFVRKIIGRIGLLLWNVACLVLLFNIVALAILSAPVPFQQLAFEQPNIAILYFPFVWLPCCVVPLVLLAHLATIRQLLARPSALPHGIAKEATSALVSLTDEIE